MDGIAERIRTRSLSSIVGIGKVSLDARSEQQRVADELLELFSENVRLTRELEHYRAARESTKLVEREFDLDETDTLKRLHKLKQKVLDDTEAAQRVEIIVGSLLQTPAVLAAVFGESDNAVRTLVQRRDAATLAANEQLEQTNAIRAEIEQLELQNQRISLDRFVFRLNAEQSSP